jgi:hypothetical protein
MIRNSRLGIDEGLCALQGYVGAYLFNAVQNTTVINPVHAAIGFAGFSYFERVIHQLSSHILQGESSRLGTIPTDRASIVSYGLATYATFKTMELTGLIGQVPTAAKIAGLLCAAALILKGSANLYLKANQLLQNVVDYTSRPQRAHELEQQQRQHNRRMNNNGRLNP